MKGHDSKWYLLYLNVYLKTNEKIAQLIEVTPLVYTSVPLSSMDVRKSIKNTLVAMLFWATSI